MRKQIQKAYVLSTLWQQIEPQDSIRVGVVAQNQSGNGTSIIHISEGEPTSDFAALELLPSGILYEDILPVQGSIWAKASAAATLTLFLKY